MVLALSVRDAGWWAFAEFDVDVRMAKIHTLGDIAVDAFYVTRSDGSLLTDPEARAELSMNAVATIESRYDWRCVRSIIEELLVSLDRPRKPISAS